MVSQDIPQDVTKILDELVKITSNYLSTISKAIAPHTLDELIREIRPLGVYVSSGRKDWYDYIEEGQGLHGEALSALPQAECNTLKRLAMSLSEQVSPLLMSIGVGSKVRQLLSMSYGEKRRVELEDNVVKTLDEIYYTAQDIEAQTQGFTDRTRKNYVYSKLTNQIQSMYDLGNTIERLKGELALVLSAPSLVVASISFPSDLNLRLEKVGITTVQPYISEAFNKIKRNEYPECCHEMRNALEEMAIQLANLITGKQAKRNFNDSIDIIKQQLGIPEDTILTIRAKDVGLYGWLSIKGSHSEGTIKGQEAKTPYEARLAINWGLSVITALLDAYVLHLQ